MNFMCQTFKLKRPPFLFLFRDTGIESTRPTKRSCACWILLPLAVLVCRYNFLDTLKTFFRLEILMLFDENYLNDAKRCFSLGIFLLIYTMFTCTILVSLLLENCVSLNLDWIYNKVKSFASFGAHTQDCVNSGKDRWENKFTNFLLQFSRMRMIMLKTLH